MDFFGFVMIIALLCYLASLVPGIILVVRLVQMGIACIKMGNFSPRDRIRFADSHGVNVLWGWVLALSIVFALVFTILFVASDEAAVAIIFGFIFPIVYLNPQIAVLIAGKIISRKYANAFMRYKMWERSQREAANIPVTEAAAPQAPALEANISE